MSDAPKKDYLTSRWVYLLGDSRSTRHIELQQQNFENVAKDQRDALKNVKYGK